MAVVIEVEVKDDGALLVHKATIAADCGPQINPERIRSQLEGACVMGLGLAALGEISFKDGKVQQDNFHQYELARMPLAPRRCRCICSSRMATCRWAGSASPACRR